MGMKLRTEQLWSVDESVLVLLGYSAVNLVIGMRLLSRPLVLLYVRVWVTRRASCCSHRLLMWCAALFVVGRRFYIIHPPTGSVIEKMVHCVTVSDTTRTNNNKCRITPRTNPPRISDDERCILVRLSTSENYTQNCTVPIFAGLTNVKLKNLKIGHLYSAFL